MAGQGRDMTPRQLHRNVSIQAGSSRVSSVHLLSGPGAALVGLVVHDWVQQRGVVAGRQVRVLRRDVHHHRIVVHAQPHLPRPDVVQV